MNSLQTLLQTWVDVCAVLLSTADRRRGPEYDNVAGRVWMESEGIDGATVLLLSLS
jgi:hypothetical protein